jgi:hypothetical protein
MVVGGTEEEQTNVTQMFDCNTGSLPMKYLGVMINDRNMSAADLTYVHHKVEKKLPTWQSVALSSGGKSILIQSSLSSIPNYTMVFICYRKKFTTRWTRPELTSFGMAQTSKENTIWPVGIYWLHLKEWGIRIH